MYGTCKMTTAKKLLQTFIHKINWHTAVLHVVWIGLASGNRFGLSAKETFRNTFQFSINENHAGLFHHTGAIRNNFSDLNNCLPFRGTQ